MILELTREKGIYFVGVDTMSFSALGTYLAKRVRRAATARDYDLSHGKLSGEVVLLIAGSQIPAVEAHNLLAEIANQNPMAIMVSGEGGRRAV